MNKVIKSDKKAKKFVTISKKREDEEVVDKEEQKYDESFEFDHLIGDIEDYFQNSLESQKSQTVALPPVLKFNKNWTLSVTDLSSQLWCEKQMEFTLITGKKRVTEEMEQGIKRHEELELEDHDLVEVEIETNEDNLGIRMLNSIILLEQLMTQGKCRELWLFHTFGNYTFCGIIDQLTIANDRGSRGKSVVISDTKTRKTKKEPSQSQVQGASLQIQVYCMMLEDTKKGDVDFEKLYESFKCNKEEPFTSEELKKEGCLAKLEKKYLRAFKKLPKISKVMELEYEHGGEVFMRSNVSLKKENILTTVEYLCTFWDGGREAEPVDKNEAWKCKMCEFKDECTVSPLLDCVM